MSVRSRLGVFVMPRDDNGLGRLAMGGEAGAFLAVHHLLAAERFETLVRRAQLAPQLTMSYSAAGGGGRESRGNSVETASDAAAEARLRLSCLAGLLPADCWGVVFDVCGLGKGLQQVETERRWPRRSAKLVLRIALDQLAAQFGLSEHARGGGHGATRGWLDDRLPLIPEDPASAQR